MKKPTLTIGICSYNEEKNALHLTQAILKQKRGNFKLSKVLIYHDSTLNREPIKLKKLAVENSSIILKVSKKRQGKITCVNNILSKNKSDIVLLLDADIALAHSLVLENIVAEFYSEKRKVDLVGGVDIPKQSKKLFGDVTNTWVEVWDTAKRVYTQDDIIHNASARILALSNRFAKKLVIPSSVVVDDQFIYLKSKQLKYRFKVAHQATVYYKVPSNFKEYLIQSIRYIHFNGHMEYYFGESIHQYYQLGKNARIKALLKVFTKKPFLLIETLLLEIVVHVGKYFFKEKSTDGSWVMVNSTK